MMMAQKNIFQVAKSAQKSGDKMYIIIGAGGFLGSYLIKTVLEKTDDNILAVSKTEKVYGAGNTRVNIFAGDLSFISYLNELAEEINKCENAKIIYTAACHNIDLVAEQPKNAYRMNVEIPEILLNQINGFSKLLFTSSDTVYGEGGKYLFKENDKLSPLSIYGEQKVKAEKVFISHGGTALRLPLMFSQSLAPTKEHFGDFVMKSLKAGKKIQMLNGAYRSTLDYGTVADIIVKLCGQKELSQIINIAGDESFSKYELSVRFAESYGLDTSLIDGVDDFGKPAADGAKRADSTLMSNELLKSILNTDEIKIKF